MEVISRSQLQQNSDNLYCSFRKRLLQNQHGCDCNITMCVLLVSFYLVQELPLPNCMKCYLFEARNLQTCLKLLEKPPNSFTSL